jgi:tRNA-modifying protein YgfZ
MPSAFLPDRAFVQITGADAEHFLQNLITTDLGGFGAEEARPGALLTPQGKILFDFLISREGDGFLIDIRADQLEAFVKRMTMYKLRAAVTIETLPETGATVIWGEAVDGVADHRFALAGTEVRRKPGQHGEAGGRDGYDALRILHGVPESGADYALQDAFPHDVLFDKSGGVSVIVSADAPLPVAGTDLTIGGKTIGTLGTVAGERGLAVIRIDKAGEAMAAGEPILAGDVPVTVTLPGWSGLTFPSAAEEV